MDRLIDYFVVSGLHRDFSDLSIPVRVPRNKALDIIDVSVINLPDDRIPKGYTILYKTLTGAVANIDHMKSMFFCWNT